MTIPEYDAYKYSADTPIHDMLVDLLGEPDDDDPPEESADLAAVLPETKLYFPLHTKKLRRMII